MNLPRKVGYPANISNLKRKNMSKKKKLDVTLYKKEMLQLVNEAIEKMKTEKQDFEVFTICIYTDFNSCYSAVCLDSKEHSDKSLSKSRKWEEEQYQKYLAQGNLEQAELFKTNDEVRETNPSEFDLSDFVSIENASFSENYEEDYSEECWETATPILLEVAQIAYKQVKEELRIHPLFELAINGEEDWYNPITPNE